MSLPEKTKKEANLIFDVGMHKGEDTAYYLRKGFTVIAFEADPNLAAACRKKFEHEITGGQLTIVEGAIVENTPGKEPVQTVRFFKNKDISVWGTVAGDWAERNEHLGTSNETIEVKAVDFRDCLKTFGIPHYLKIDIEGIDLVCLRALLDFEQKPDYVSVESEKISFQKLKEEFDLFRKLGYMSFKAVNQANISQQQEPKDTREGKYAGHSFQSGSSGVFGTDLPQKWKTEKQVLKQYKTIFLGYGLFGDYGKFKNSFLGRNILKVINKISRSPVPGWYDTHARHASVME